MVFYLITYANKPHEGLDMLKKSAEKFGVKLNVLGMNDPDDVGHGKGGRFGRKLNAAKMFVATVDADDIVAFVDGFDVLVTGTESEMVARFLEFGKSVVFSAENACAPECNTNGFRTSFNDLFPGETLRYINSGTYIGYAGAISSVLDNGDASFETGIDDQTYMQGAFLDNRSDMTLDTRASIFYVCSIDSLDYEQRIREDLVVSDGRVNCVSTGSSPLFVHFDGLSKTAMPHYFKQLFGYVMPHEALKRHTVFIGFIKDNKLWRQGLIVALVFITLVSLWLIKRR